MSDEPPNTEPLPTVASAGWSGLPPRRRSRRWIVALVAAVVVAVAAVLVVTDPFKGGGQAPASYDNSYPTSLTTITEQSLSAQTDVDATLGYAGSYAVAIPSGTPASTVTADEQALQAAQTKVSDDEASLSSARSLESSEQAATLLAAEGTVSTDQTTLTEARGQLAADERLNCPAASSATVTTAIGSGSPSSGDSSPGTSTPGSSSPGSSTPSTSSPTGSTGTGHHDPSLDVVLRRAGDGARRVTRDSGGDTARDTGSHPAGDPTGGTGTGPVGTTGNGSTPGTSPPGTSPPGTSPPGTSPPGTSAPGTSAPGTSSPGTSTPGTPTPPTGGSAPDTTSTTVPSGSSPSGSVTTTSGPGADSSSGPTTSLPGATGTDSGPGTSSPSDSSPGTSSPSDSSPGTSSPSDSSPGTSSPSDSSPSDSTPGGSDSGSATTTTVQPPSAPTVMAPSASNVSSRSVTLSGSVDPDGVATTYRFEYGTSSADMKQTAAVTLTGGQAVVEVTADLTGLRPDATYQFALVATNALGTSASPAQTFDTMQSSCQEQSQVVASDVEAVAAAQDALAADEASAGSTVTSDEQQLSSDEEQLAADSQALSLAQNQATNPATRFTTLPAVGARIGRGESVYWLDGGPVPLFYGTTTPYRAMYLGVSDGPDVQELQANLIALGFGNGMSADGHFDVATEEAVKAWQASLGVPATGVVSLGDLVIEPSALRVLTVSATLGQAAAAGTAVLTASSTTREVTIDLDAAQQSSVKVGDPVSITLPDNATTPGVVSSVGTVATEPSSNGANGSTGEEPTITVEVTPTDPSATGGLDQAPVEVAITSQSVSNVLAVPVDALLALAGGGYAVEEVTSGVHHLVAVNLGLFDDANGMVQVSGSGLAAGQSIVVPNL